MKKLIVSRDVSFDESSVTDEAVSVDKSIDIVDQGGEVVKVDDNIISNAECREDVANPDSDNDPDDTQNNENEEEFQDAQEDTPPLPRRSARIRKQSGEWWKSSNIDHALSARTVPISYKKATTPENINFWMPGIEREHDCLMRNKTWTLVRRQHGMHVLPSKYVFRVKNGGPKARLVALGCRQLYGVDYLERLHQS